MMQSIISIFWLVPLLGLACLFWFLADLRFAQQWSLERAELGAQDKLRELNAHFEVGIKCRRPMLRLFQHFVIPGLLEADYALHLSNQGENEQALALAEEAIRKSSKRPHIQIAVLPAKSTILLRLGRYLDAKQVVQLGKRLLAGPAFAAPGNCKARIDGTCGMVLQEGLIELNLGNLEGALRLGIEAGAATVCDPARALVSGVLAALGRFSEALEALVYEPSTFARFLKPEELDLLAEDKLFQETAREIDEELAGVFGPAANLGMAMVYFDTGDAANLGAALERTQNELKANQAMEHIFLRTRACWHAMKGDVAGVEDDLRRTRKITDERPASRSAKYEYHLAAGRARFLLGEFGAAVGELSTALRLALHPMEKHVSTYWLARATESADQPAAEGLFGAVIADGFGSWMEKDSRLHTAQS